MNPIFFLIRLFVFTILRRIIGWPGIILIGGMLYLYFRGQFGG